MIDSKLYHAAKAIIGKDASPKDLVKDGVGCAESLSTLLRATVLPTFPIKTGTWSLYDELQAHAAFKRVTVPIPGDIILCVTGMGRGTIPNGHCGVLGENGRIMSNDSPTGQWKENYSLDTWHQRYVIAGKYPQFYYRML